MRIVLINQAFYPDVVATGQILTDLALGLVERGHEVTVVTGRRAYDDPQKVFAKEESLRYGVRDSARIGHGIQQASTPAGGARLISRPFSGPVAGG